MTKVIINGIVAAVVYDNPDIKVFTEDSDDEQCIDEYLLTTLKSNIDYDGVSFKHDVYYDSSEVDVPLEAIVDNLLSLTETLDSFGSYDTIRDRLKNELNLTDEQLAKLNL